MLQPEPQSCLPPTHSSHAWPLAVATLPLTGNATVESLPSCFRLSPPARVSGVALAGGIVPEEKLPLPVILVHSHR